MQGGPEACPQVQGICIQHMKAVQGLTYDEMKDYLADSIEKDFFNFKLDPYKTRSACGLQAHLVRKDKKTEIAYFRSFLALRQAGTKAWCFPMSLAPCWFLGWAFNYKLGTLGNSFTPSFFIS